MDLLCKSIDWFLCEGNYVRATVAFNVLSELKRINLLLVLLKSSENCRFSNDFRGNRRKKLLKFVYKWSKIGGISNEVILQIY